MNYELEYIIKSVIEELEELSNEDSSDFVNGQKLAYTTILGRAKEMVAHEPEKYNLDFNIDAKYLNFQKTQKTNHE